MVDFTIFKNLAKWLFPFEVIQANPEIPIYIFIICAGIGFIILNYKYIINKYNDIYEKLSFLTKITLSLSVGFIITITSLVLLVIFNAVSNLFFGYDLIGNIWVGTIYLILALAWGFIYFGHLKIRDPNNPFYDIKKIFSFSVGLIILAAFSLFVLALYHELVFKLYPKQGFYSFWIYANKIFWGFITLYFICKLIDSGYEKYEREYETRLPFHGPVRDYIGFVEGQWRKLKLFLRNLKLKILKFF